MPPAYVAGTTDIRRFAIDGCTLHARRGRESREVGFVGIGRDGDYVPDDAPEPAILARVLGAIVDLRRAYWPSCPVDSEETLAAAEEALARAGGGYASISRETSGLRAAAEALLALPMEPGLARKVYLCGDHAFDLAVPVDGDASAYEWKWGEATGTWLETTLAELGAPLERVGGSDAGRVYRVPRVLVAALVARALDRFGASDVRLYDAPG